MSYLVEKPKGRFSRDEAHLFLIFDIHANTPESCDYKDSKLIFPAAGHTITGNLKIISDSRIRYIVSKGPKYKFPSCIYYRGSRPTSAVLCP